MPQSTDSQLEKPSTIPAGLRRFIPTSLTSRRKVFFDSPGLLEQSQHWGGLVIWTIAAGTTASLFWAFLGRVDQTVTAGGTLQPINGKMIVSSPAGGIVRELFVSDGEIVAKGDELMVVESEATKDTGIVQKTQSRTVKKRLMSCPIFLFRFPFPTFFQLTNCGLGGSAGTNSQGSEIWTA